MGFPGGSDGKASACNAGDLGSTPGSGRSPGEGNGNQLQYSCLETPMDREAWQTTVHGVAKSQTNCFTNRVTDLSTFQDCRVTICLALLDAPEQFSKVVSSLWGHKELDMAEAT